MRVLMLDNEFPPLGGGMGTANEALLRRFADRPDMEIDLVTAALGNRLESEQFAKRIRIFKVPVWNKNIHHSTNRELLLYTAQALPLALRLHRAQPYDFCFAWSAVPAGAIARAVQWRTGLPYMVWVSGPDIPGFERRYRYIYPILTPLIRSIWRESNTVIAKCREEIDMIHAVDPRLEARLIPNGVDLTIFRPGLSPADSGPLRVICAARLIERKGQHHLIEAVRILRDRGVQIYLELVGTGDGQNTLVEQVQRLGVCDCVEFVGYVPRECIPARYAAADVFALPSYNEGLSLAALEALAAGLPLILSRTGGTSDLVEEGLNGLTFDWANVDALANHLERLACDRLLLHRMGIESRRRAARFSWESIAEQFLQLFQTAMPHMMVHSTQ